MRTGCSDSGKNKSTIPPRTANSPRFSTKSVRVYARLVKLVIKVVKSTSLPISKLCNGWLARSAMKRWITARIGATKIVFSLFGDAKSAKVAKRRATVSLRGLKRSCGRVSQAGNSSTLLCNSRSSDAKSSALRLELVTTRIDDFSATLASKKG